MTRTLTRTAGDRLALARLLDARVRSLVCRTNRSEALVAALLSTIAGQGLDRALGFKSVNDYARSVADWDATKTSRMVTLVGHLKQLPEMRRAFFKGELPGTKACIAAAVAVTKPESDALWTENARTLSRDKLEQLKREELNEPARIRVVLLMTVEGKACLDGARVALQRERGEVVSLETVVEETCRRTVLPGVTQGAVVDAGPRPLVVFGVCIDCKTTTNGSAVVPAAEVGPALCNSDVVDFTVEPPEQRPSIPPRVVAEVLARDQGQCRVPGCTNRTWLELHHEGGWRAVGHDPARITTLCMAHHKARHEGLLKIVFDSGSVTFALADGEVLGVVDLRVLRTPSTGRGAASARTGIAPALTIDHIFAASSSRKSSA